MLSTLLRGLGIIPQVVQYQARSAPPPASGDLCQMDLDTATRHGLADMKPLHIGGDVHTTVGHARTLNADSRMRDVDYLAYTLNGPMASAAVKQEWKHYKAQGDAGIAEFLDRRGLGGSAEVERLKSKTSWWRW